MSEQTSFDRRIIRTKSSIREALIQLMEEKGFDALSVKDITAKANINRGTFYLHYRDKYDLLEQTEAEIISDIETIFERTGLHNASELKHTGEPLPFLVVFFEYLNDHAALMRAVLGLKGKMAFQTQIKKAMERNLFKEEGIAQVYHENSQIPTEYLISYVVAAHLGVVQSWLQKGCKETPVEMALILSRMTYHGPLNALGLGLE